MKQVLVIGGGSIGSVTGSRLAKNAAVSVVCRSNFKDVLQNGYQITSPVWGTYSFKPHNVFSSTEEARKAGPFDHLVLTTKALMSDEELFALLNPVVSQQSAIHIIQNGVGVEEPIVSRFKNVPISSSVTYLAVTIESNAVKHHGITEMVIGGANDFKSDALNEFASLLKAGDLDVRVIADVQLARWHKLMWNASFNPISIVAGCVDTQTLLSDESSEKLIRNVMHEICEIASMETRQPFPPHEMFSIDQYIDRTRLLGAYIPSMLSDWKFGRPIEIQPILGNPIQIAVKHGIPVPHLTTVYAILKSCNAARK